jgi:LysM repeat protein
MIPRFNLWSIAHVSATLFLVTVLVCAVTDLQAQTAERRTHVVEAGQTLYSISRMYDVSVEDLRRWNNLRGNQINVGQRLVVSSGQQVQQQPAQTTQQADTRGRDAREVRHQVRSGETLFSISRRYGVTVSEIREWNGLRSNLIEVGQVLIIREAVQDVTERASTQASGRSEEGRAADTAAAQSEGGATAASSGAGTASQSQVSDTTGGQESATLAASTDTSAQSEAGRTQSSDPIPPVAAVVDEGDAIRSGPVASAYYTVRAGDSVSEIARRHGITSSELMELNSLRSDRLAVGQVLLVRRPQGLPSITELRAGSTPQGRFATYQVRRGERLNDVLRQFQMTESELVALNPDIDITSLAQGQSLTVLMPPDITYANPYRVFAAPVDSESIEADTETVQIHRYGNNDRGRSTTSGDLYNPDAFTAAHNRLPLGTVLFVQNPDNQSGIFVLVNDRIVEQGLRLSHAAFDALGFEPTRANNAVISSAQR